MKKVSDEDLQTLENAVDKMFHWALVWSVGCTTDLLGRNKFNTFLKELNAKKLVKVFPE